MSEIILITVSGQDKPGLTSSIMGMLAEYDVLVLDIGQAMVQETLSLAILAKLPDQEKTAPVLKDVLFHVHQLDMKVRFTPIDEADYEAWVQGEEQPRYVVTLVGRSLTATHISRITRVITDNDLNIEDIVRLSGRAPLHDGGEHNRSCLELTLRGQPIDLDAMKKSFLDIAQELGIDISFQEENLFRRNRRLVVFDMDSTLIQQEVIDEMAKAAGAGEEVSRITEAAMRGELDFSESLQRRVAALEGLDASVLDRIAGELTLTEGAERLLRTLKLLGYKTAVLSGGFTYFGRYVQQKLDLDYVFANELEILDGRVTGRLVGEIVDGQKKAELLRRIAEEEQITLDQVIAVGDGANDLPMLREAGLGIAFHAKPVVQQSARQAISTVGLDGILYLMGLKDTETPH